MLAVELRPVVALVACIEAVKVEEVVHVLKRALDDRLSLEHEARCILNQHVRILHAHDLPDGDLKRDHTVVINVSALALISELEASFAEV